MGLIGTTTTDPTSTTGREELRDEMT